jgi:hypothetical protein
MECIQAGCGVIVEESLGEDKNLDFQTNTDTVTTTTTYTTQNYGNSDAVEQGHLRPGQ